MWERGSRRVSDNVDVVHQSLFSYYFAIFQLNNGILCFCDEKVVTMNHTESLYFSSTFLLKLVLSFSLSHLFILVTVVLFHRRKSRSGTPHRRQSRSPAKRHKRSRSPITRRHRRRRSHSSSESPLPKSRSPSLTSTERKSAAEKLKKEEEEKKRFVRCDTVMMFLWP